MRAHVLIMLCLGFLAIVGGSALADEGQHRHEAGDPERLGAVAFPISCGDEAQARFSRGVAMLHSFWYDEARKEFERLAEADASCAMAWWGVAMSHWQPLWEPRGPDALALRSGAAAVRAAREAGAEGRERAFVDAVATFFEDADTVDHEDRVLAYESAMERVHARWPEDTEARLFYAHSLLASATTLPPDKTYARQRKAGDLLMPVLESQPDHPGVAHYIIHAYDYPSLARDALEAARRYAEIAPDSPHAQHMPSHIFTRLGLWDDSIRSNRNVIRVARKYGIVGEELHARDYLVFAYLQKGDDDSARAVMDEMPQAAAGTPLTFAGIYAHAAIPARYAVERRQWEEAAALPEPVDFPGGRYAWANAAIHFARALGAARSGNVEQGRAEVEKLASLQDTLDRHKEDYWRMQVEIQRVAAEAWLALAQGRKEQALERMRAAAELEDGTEKHPVTPGQIVPARDLLGQMLLELERPDEALAEFEAVLAAEPDRFGALYGAAQAAELAGRQAAARERYARLLEVAPDSVRPEVQQASAYLARAAVR